MRPTIGNGKICYVEMPATDIERSAAFYRAVFGWTIRIRGSMRYSGLAPNVVTSTTFSLQMNHFCCPVAYPVGRTGIRSS